MQTKLQMENIIYKVIVGSHAYGTNVEGSDMDIKGIYIQSPEDVLERGYQEQVTVNKDEVYYEIRRFVELACGGNPTVLELLWSPPDCVLYKHEIMDRLLENRTGFLSKSCRHSFGGYAFAQIDKARGLNKKMNWEACRVTRKNILDFCYVIQNGKSHSLKEWLETQPPHYRDQSKWGAAKINNARDLYCIYPDQDNGYHGLVNSDETSNELRLSSIPEECMSDGVVMSYNKDGYMEHCKDYLSYQKWLKERNVQRYIDIEAHGQKIDCHLKNNTQFLTQSGWKFYDEITEDDKLASLDKRGILTFSNYLNRFDNLYTGTMFLYEDRYSKFIVTPNHRLLLSYLNRSSKNNFTCDTEFNNLNTFEYISVEDYHSKRKNWAKIVHAPLKTPKKTQYKLTNEQIKILGAYISDGSLYDSYIRIDQKHSKQLHGFLKNSSYSRKGVYRGSYTGLEYEYYTFKDKKLINFILKHVGKGSLYKKMDAEFFKFSKRQFDILLDYMIRGDGYVHPKGYRVYYTSSKQLAIDLQTLLFLNGYTSQLYTVNHKGGFKNSSEIKYQVMISKNSVKFSLITKRSNWSKLDVVAEGVVCFTTIHGNIVTKVDDKIAIQGNSKNLLHCYRLIETGIEIAREKTVNVRRPNREFLVGIRKGHYNLEELLSRAEGLLQDLNTAFQQSDLPDKVDRGFYLSLVVKIRKEYYQKENQHGK